VTHAGGSADVGCCSETEDGGEMENTTTGPTGDGVMTPGKVRIMQRPHNRQAFRKLSQGRQRVLLPLGGSCSSATDCNKDVRAYEEDVAGEMTRNLPHDQTVGVSVKNVVGRKGVDRSTIMSFDVGLVGREISDSFRNGP
jgi:hypothetical protein